MILIAPDYYPHFRCIADKCRHSCCVGWEIDVDEDALRRYRQVDGPMGARLQEAIDLDGDAPHFRLGKDERCPFLNENGLCDLITHLGEDSLCQICADHPRFRSFYQGHTEIGLGLCCEAAGRLILSWPDTVRLIPLEDDGEEESPTAEEEAFLALRDRLMAIAQDRSVPIEERVAQLEAMSGVSIPETSLPRWAAFMLDLERLDEAWTHRLERLMASPPDEISSDFSIQLEQLLVYLLYRHLPGALEDDDLPGRLAFAVLSWKMIRALLHQGEQTLDALVETARLYSSEIEYSDDNTAALLDALDEGGIL